MLRLGGVCDGHEDRVFGVSIIDQDGIVLTLVRPDRLLLIDYKVLAILHGNTVSEILILIRVLQEAKDQAREIINGDDEAIRVIFARKGNARVAHDMVYKRKSLDPVVLNGWMVVRSTPIVERDD